MAGRRTFRLILLDFALPDSHGYAGMLRLQRRDPDAPIAIVTAHENPRLIEAAKALGAAGFLYKSLPLDTIAGILRRILAGATHFPEGVAPDRSIAAGARASRTCRARNMPCCSRWRTGAPTSRSRTTSRSPRRR